MIRVFDRVKETSSTTGSGTITLAGAAAGFQSFGSVLSSGDQTYYTLVNGNAWEVGLGTYANSSLTRNTVLSSSNSGNLLSLSGSTTAFVAYPAEVSVYRNLSRQIVADTGGILFSDGSILTNAIVSGTVPVGGTNSQLLAKSGSSNYITQWVDPSSIIPTGINALNIANGTVNNTEFQYLDGVTSGIQGQLDLKASIVSLTGYYSVTNPSGYVTLAYVSGYQPLDADLTSIASASGTGIYYRSASNTWSLATIGSGLSFSSGTLSNTLDLSGYATTGNYVPYSGAVNNLNLGSYTLTTGGATVNGTVTANKFSATAGQTEPYTVVEYYGTTYLDRVVSGRGLARRADVISFEGVGGSAAFEMRLYNGTLSFDVTGGWVSVAPVATDHLGIFRSTNASALSIYNTYTSATNFERGTSSWVSNEWRIGTAVGSAGGTQRNYVIGAWDSSSTWAAGATMTPAGNWTFTPSSLTGSSATTAISLTQTWNTSGTPTLISANVTDTASNASSLLLDLQVSGVSKFKVSKSGKWTVPATNTGAAQEFSATSVALVCPAGIEIYNGPRSGYWNWDALTVRSDSFISWASSTSVPQGYGDLCLARDAADTLGQRRSTNAQTHSWYNTYTSSTNFERGTASWASNEWRIGTAIGSAGGTQRSLVLGTWNSAGTWAPAVTVDSTGTTTFQTTGSADPVIIRSPSQTPWAVRIYNQTYSTVNPIFDFYPQNDGSFMMGTNVATSFNFYTNSYSNVRMSLSGAQGNLQLTPSASTSGSQTGFTYTGANATGQTASTEAVEVIWTMPTKTWATGALTTQRFFRITQPTMAFAGASTVTTASTLSIAGAPAAGTNATITNAYALNVESGITNLPTGSSSVPALRIGAVDLWEEFSSALCANRGRYHYHAGVRAYYQHWDGITIRSDAAFSWANSTTVPQGAGGGTCDVNLFRGGNGILELRNSTNAQTFRLYNTYTSSTNFENLQTSWVSNEARIGTAVGSAGGMQRATSIGNWNSSGVFSTGILVATGCNVTIPNGLTVYSYSFPSGVGLSGQALTTNGVNQLSWTTISGSGGSLTGSASGVVYFNNLGNATSDSNFLWNSSTTTLRILGNISATTKSFVIPHPIKENKLLQYASLEGPENGVYVRGTSYSDITLPDYWDNLIDVNTITVTLTPNGKFQPLYVITKSTSKIEVGGVDHAYGYDYTVFAERKDVDKLKVEL